MPITSGQLVPFDGCQECVINSVSPVRSKYIKRFLLAKDQLEATDHILQKQCWIGGTLQHVVKYSCLLSCPELDEKIHISSSGTFLA